jgi:hypothetical protein
MNILKYNSNKKLCMLYVNLPNKNKKTRIILSSVVAVILFSVLNPVQFSINAQINDSTCNVEILGGSSNMYPGEHVYLAANVTGETPKIYTWTVEGPIIKEYDANVYNSTYLTAYLNIDPPTYMSPADFKQSSLSFYWQPNNTDTIRTVSLKVQTTNNGVCEVSRDFTVTKNNDNINLQAEDFFVEKNHPVGLTTGLRNNTQILQQHQQWHNDNFALNESYSEKGSLFFDFHRIYIAHFDAWRDLFGYPRIIAWDPGTSLPVGVEIDHANRRVNETDPYTPLTLPSWFRHHQGAEGPENRTILFVRSFPGQDQLPVGHPLTNIEQQIQFVGPIDPNNPRIGWLAFLNGHTLPMCEEMDYPKNSSNYPLAQNSLGDFEPDQVLLGCALTQPYHDGRHGAMNGRMGTGSDMADTAHSPRDPIFWRLHKFLDNVSVQRFFPPLTDVTFESITGDVAVDTVPPQIIAQNPFILYPYITSLPTISEKEKGLFGITDVPAISAQFNEPVTGVKASDFRVNGSPATQVSGTGVGPYVFIGFKSPEMTLLSNRLPVNVTLSSGNITDISGNRFEGSSWNYTLVRPDIDQDKDGLKDELEVNVIRTNPTDEDSDKDTILDGEEAVTDCLNPLVSDAEIIGMTMQDINRTITEPRGMTMQDINRTITEPRGMTMQDINRIHADFDRDNKTNVEEVQNKTDPCSIESSSSLLTTDIIIKGTNITSQENFNSKSLPSNNMTSAISASNIIDSDNNNNTNVTMPFAFLIKKTGGIAGTSSQLQYDSFSKTAVSIVNGNESKRQISSADEVVAKQILNDSGFFDSKSFYPPAPNSADYFEYTIIATLNGKLQAIYWTDASKDVPYGISNLPYILYHILGSGGVF